MKNTKAKERSNSWEVIDSKSFLVGNCGSKADRETKNHLQPLDECVWSAWAKEV